MTPICFTRENGSKPPRKKNRIFKFLELVARYFYGKSSFHQIFTVAAAGILWNIHVLAYILEKIFRNKLDWIFGHAHAQLSRTKQENLHYCTDRDKNCIATFCVDWSQATFVSYAGQKFWKKPLTYYAHNDTLYIKMNPDFN